MSSVTGNRSLRARLLPNCYRTTHTNIHRLKFTQTHTRLHTPLHTHTEAEEFFAPESHHAHTHNKIFMYNCCTHLDAHTNAHARTHTPQAAHRLSNRPLSLPSSLRFPECISARSCQMALYFQLSQRALPGLPTRTP